MNDDGRSLNRIYRSKSPCACKKNFSQNYPQLENASSKNLPNFSQAEKSKECNFEKAPNY